MWEFARGCMRSYLILRDKAWRFRHDPEIQEALAVAQTNRLAEATVPPGGIETIRNASYDLDSLTRRGHGHERLDQLVTELLLGVR